MAQLTSRRGFLALALFATVLLGGVLVFPTPWWLNASGQFCIALLACLSMNLLLGQGGLLSFGQAVYFGLGAYAVVWAKSWLPTEAGWLAWGIMGLPLLGGAVAMGVASLLGPWTVRHGGAAFAMITLALGELVWTMAQVFPGVFGGEGGWSLDRSAYLPFFEANLGREQVMVVVMVVYAVAGFGWAHWVVGTPLGLAWRASRDNPQRAQSLGYDLLRLRQKLLNTSACLCGVAGALFALYFEHVTTEALGGQRSSQLLVFTLLGGVGSIWGAVVSGLLMVAANQWLSQITPGWMIYVGLVLILAVVHGPRLRGGKVGAAFQWKQPMIQMPWLLASAVTGLALVALIEMAYQWRERSTESPLWQVAGLSLDLHHPLPWTVALACLIAGGLCVRHCQRPTS